MKVVTFETSDGKTRYYLADDNDVPVEPVLEYLRFGDNRGLARNTLTLHYSKVSEDMLYKKWSETEKLNLFKPDAPPPDPKHQNKEGLHYELVRKNLDAVKVPFGVCFKPSKIGCKSQMKMCLECGSFCSTAEDLSAYESEIKRVAELIGISNALRREEWSEKNQKYLETLEAMRDRILREGLVHKNGRLRED